MALSKIFSTPQEAQQFNAKFADDKHTGISNNALPTNAFRKYSPKNPFNSLGAGAGNDFTDANFVGSVAHVDFRTYAGGNVNFNVFHVSWLLYPTADVRVALTNRFHAVHASQVAHYKAMWPADTSSDAEITAGIAFFIKQILKNAAASVYTTRKELYAAHKGARGVLEYLTTLYNGPGKDDIYRCPNPLFKALKFDRGTEPLLGSELYGPLGAGLVRRKKLLDELAIAMSSVGGSSKILYETFHAKYSHISVDNPAPTPDEISYGEVYGKKWLKTIVHNRFKKSGTVKVDFNACVRDWKRFVFMMCDYLYQDSADFDVDTHFITKDEAFAAIEDKNIIIDSNGKMLMLSKLNKLGAPVSVASALF